MRQVIPYVELRGRWLLLIIATSDGSEIVFNCVPEDSISVVSGKAERDIKWMYTK